MKENLRAVGAAHVARALLANRLGIYASAPLKLLPAVDHDPPRGPPGFFPFALGSAELAIPPGPLLEQEHPSPIRALLDLCQHFAVVETSLVPGNRQIRAVLDDSRGVDSRGVDSRGVDSRGVDSRGAV